MTFVSPRFLSLTARHFTLGVLFLLCANACAQNSEVAAEKMLKTDEQVVEMVKLILQDAKSKISSDEWKEANDLLKMGLELVSERYFVPHLRDDSEMKLMLSNRSEKKGDLDRSAKGRNTILKDRLELLKEKLEKQKVAEQGK